MVPGRGKAVTIGSSPMMYPNGWSWMPANIRARRTAIPMVAALNVPRWLSWASVRGKLMKKQINTVTALNAIVHAAEPDKVLRSFAPTSTCRAALD